MLTRLYLLLIFAHFCFSYETCFTAKVIAKINMGASESKLGKICIGTEQNASTEEKEVYNLMYILYGVGLEDHVMTDGYIGYFSFQNPYPKLPISQKIYSKFNLGGLAKYSLNAYSTEILWINISDPIIKYNQFPNINDQLTIKSFSTEKFSFTFTNLHYYPKDLYQQYFIVLFIACMILKSVPLIAIIRRLIASPEVWTDRIPFLSFACLAYTDIYSVALFLNSLATPWPIAVCLLCFASSVLSLTAVFFSYMQSERPEHADMYDRFSFARSAVMSVATFLVFCSPLVAYNKIADDYCIWVLLPLVALIIDNYIYAFDVICPILIIGALGIHVVSSWSFWIALIYCSGMHEMKFFTYWNFIFLALFATLLMIQAFVDPRFGIRRRIFDRNEYLTRSKPMLLEDLMKNSEISDQDICGICLLHFNPVIAEKELSATMTNDNSATLDKDFINLFLKTKCGHIFHKYCLETWCETQKNCPLCRNKVT